MEKVIKKSLTSEKLSQSTKSLSKEISSPSVKNLQRSIIDNPKEIICVNNSLNSGLKFELEHENNIIDNSAKDVSMSVELEQISPTVLKEYELDWEVKVKIIKETSSQFKYIIIEPELNDAQAKLLEEIKGLLIEELDVDARKIGSSVEAEEFLVKEIERLVKNYRYKVRTETLRKIEYYIKRDFVNYGKINPLMRDPYIEDISCNGPDLPVYIWHREFESIPTNIMFSTSEELDRFVIKLTDMARKAVSIAQPVVDATLPDGSRVQVTYEKEITRRGSSFTIRKFHENPLTVTDLIASNTLSAEMAAWFWYVIEKRASIILVGGTASGKTTTINMLSMFIKPTAKIISIEDTAELQLPHENWLPSIVRSGFGLTAKHAEITLFDLLKNAMRQRPEYLIVGEVRGAEAYTLFQAVATGHGGLATLHGESTTAAIRRLESEPMNIPRSLVTTLDAIIVISRVQLKGKSVRRIISVTEILGVDPVSREIVASEVFRWNPINDSYIYSGRSHLLHEMMEKQGINYDKVKSELETRRKLIEWMVRNNLHNYQDVVDVIRSYYMDPQSLEMKTKAQPREEDQLKLKTEVQVTENELLKQEEDSFGLETNPPTAEVPLKLETESSGSEEGFCMKCRKKVEMVEVHEENLKNNRMALVGRCPECGTKVVRILGITATKKTPKKENTEPQMAEENQPKLETKIQKTEVDKPRSRLKAIFYGFSKKA